MDESEDDLDPDIIPPSPEPELVGYSKRVLFHSLQPASLLVDHVESQPGPSNCNLSRPTDNIIDGGFFDCHSLEIEQVPNELPVGELRPTDSHKSNRPNPKHKQKNLERHQNSNNCAHRNKREKYKKENIYF